MSTCWLMLYDILDATSLFFRRVDNFSKEEDVVILFVSDKDHEWTIKPQSLQWAVRHWSK